MVPHHTYRMTLNDAYLSDDTRNPCTWPRWYKKILQIDSHRDDCVFYRQPEGLDHCEWLRLHAIHLIKQDGPFMKERKRSQLHKFEQERYDWYEQLAKYYEGMKHNYLSLTGKVFVGFPTCK